MIKKNKLFGNLLSKYDDLEFSKLNSISFRCVIDDSLIKSKNIVKHESEKTLHFIWIGIPDDKVYLYLRVWSHHYPDYDINLWIDSKFLYANYYKSKVRAGFKRKKLIDILKMQDSNYEVYNKNNLGNDALDSLIESKFNKRFHGKESKDSIIQCLKQKYDFLNILDIRKNKVILNHKLEKYYEKEIVLRANIAAASDILRLCILKKYGGVYLDVDTLPCLDYVFKKSNRYVDIEIANNEFVEIYKSQLYLDKFNNSYSNNEISLSLEAVKKSLQAMRDIYFDNEKINYYLELIQCDINEHDIVKVNSTPFMLHEKLLMFGSSKTKLNTFYNNVLACDKNSSVVSIILKEICKRYDHIEKNEYDKWYSVNKYNDLYGKGSMERLIGYRLDGFANIPNSTVILTGPCMILEVYLSITYKIFRIKSNIDPRKVAAVYQAKNNGICCCNITTFTLENSKSTWM
ncbi:hypothetical protein ABRI19_003339 [Vibrio cholerae]